MKCCKRRQQQRQQQQQQHRSPAAPSLRRTNTLQRHIARPFDTDRHNKHHSEPHYHDTHGQQTSCGILLCMLIKPRLRVLLFQYVYFFNLAESFIRKSDEWKAKVPIMLEVGFIGSFSCISNCMCPLLAPIASNVIHRLFAPCADYAADVKKFGFIEDELRRINRFLGGLVGEDALLEQSRPAATAGQFPYLHCRPPTSGNSPTCIAGRPQTVPLVVVGIDDRSDC